MHPALEPAIDIPDGVRIEVLAWGRWYPCHLKGETLCFTGGMVEKTADVRVLSPQAQAMDAEDVVYRLKKWGWKNAIARIDHGAAKGQGEPG